MIKESKYILRRILIGVGIILVLSFIRGNKVKAFESTKSVRDYNFYINNPDYTYLATNTYLFNGSSRTNYYFYDNNNNLVIALSSGSFTDITDNRLSEVKNFVIVKNMQNENQNGLIFFNEPEKLYFQNNTLRYIPSVGNYYFYGLKAFGVSTPTIVYPSVFAGGSNIRDYTFNSNYTSEDIVFSTFDIYDNNGNLIHSSDLVSTSTIESLQPTKITNNNVITGYIFRPKFSNFNTDNFVYQYKVGKDSSRWLSLTSNEQQIKINNNIELYVRIKDKNTNEVVDSQTFTITDISKFNTEQNYNITFSGEYRTENYLNNNISSKSQSLIKEYQIYVDYTPKTSILKYQYQYVKNGDSLNNDNWQQVASSDNGSFTYVATENGTLFTRILDSSDNNLYSASFTVNNIGLLAFDSNENGVNNFFTKLSSKINYGGPVSSLFVIPVNTLNSLYSSMSNSSSCSPIQLGSLLGTNMQFGCYDFKSIVGNEVYNIIDIIFAFVLTIGVFKFILKLYNNFISMKEV